MKMQWIAWMALAGAALAGCGRREDPATEAYPEEQAKIRQVLEEVREGVAKKDAARVEALHLYGPKYTKFDEAMPAIRLDAAAAREAERRMLTGPAAVEVSFQDLKVDVFGPAAVATGFLDYRVKAGDKAFAGKDRMTLVLVKAGDGWKITHEHTSAAARAEASTR